MNNDLISREVLKEAIRREVIENRVGVFVAKRIIKLIDNAPTEPQDCSECKRFDFPYVTMNVEFTEEEKQEIIERVRKDLLIFPDENANERPKGEWIRYRDNPHQPEHIKCSNCGQYWSVADHDKTFDFCFKCGARMRGGAE